MQREVGPCAHLRNRFGALTRDALLQDRVRGPKAHERDLGSVDPDISTPNLLRHIGASPIVAESLTKHAGWPRKERWMPRNEKQGRRLAFRVISKPKDPMILLQVHRELGNPLPIILGC